MIPYLILTVILSISLTLFSCSKSKSSDASNTAIVQSTVSTLASIEKISELIDPTDTTSSWFRFLDAPLYALAIGDNWTNTALLSIRNPENDGDSPDSPDVSLKEFMISQFDPSSVRHNGSSTNMFGRIDDALAIFCGLGMVIETDADGLPELGSQDITLDEDFVEEFEDMCGDQIGGDMEGAELSITVAANEDDTLFDYKVTASNDDGFNSSYYLRYTADEANIAALEESKHGEYRTVILHNKADDIIRAEYFSASNDGSTDAPLYVYRILFNETTKSVKLAIREGGSTTDYIFYTAEGKIDTDDPADTFALSLSLSDTYNNAGSGTDGFEDLNACIDINANVDTDNTLVCTEGDLTGSASSTVKAAIIDNVVDANGNEGCNTLSDKDTGDINFQEDGSDFFSATFTVPSS